MAIIENHNGDSLANVYSNARNNYYSISGYPTYFFDGILSVVGGSGSSSMYGSYVPKVNARNAILSDFTIDVEFEETEGDYTATITVDNVGGNTTTGLVLQVTITESKLPITWGLAETVNFVNRLMVPDQFGTTLDFSSSSTQVIELEFTMEDYWDKDNCEIVAFVQDNTTKEILQGTKKFMAVPLFSIDVQAKSVKFPTGEYCGSSVEPIILMKNMGGDNLTSADIEYSINGGTPMTYEWTGDLGFNLGEEITLPAITFMPEEVNTLEVTISNPNGQVDPNPDNNYLAHEFNAAPQVATTNVLFELKTDNYPSETTWEVTNSEGVTLYSGGPYSQANTVFNETWELDELECYTFTIYDAWGDGICCDYGIGYYKLMDENDAVFAEGGEFGSEESKPFERFDENVLSANFTASATTIYEGESVDFSDLSTGTSITTWYWEFEGGDPATSDEQNPTVTYVVEGVYDVSLTVSDGTQENTMVKEDYITVDNLTGIDPQDMDEVKVYPNPSRGEVYVTGVTQARVTVYNTSGTIVAEVEEFNGGRMDLSDLDRGIYFLNIVIDNDNSLIRKISLLK